MSSSPSLSRCVLRATRALMLTTGLVVSMASVAAADGNRDQAVQQAKAATARLHSLEQAKKAGYLAPRPGDCVASPLGAMGYHFENHALMRDGILDVRRPEVLLYERTSDGKFKLTGVEYFIEADQTTSAPILFGQTFDGPMGGHHPGMEEHYDLHAWLWKDNPRGTFAQWNPTVSCP